MSLNEGEDGIFYTLVFTRRQNEVWVSMKRMHKNFSRNIEENCYDKKVMKERLHLPLLKKKEHSSQSSPEETFFAAHFHASQKRGGKQ